MLQAQQGKNASESNEVCSVFKFAQKAGIVTLLYFLFSTHNDKTRLS